MQSLLQRTTAFLTPSTSSSNLTNSAQQPTPSSLSRSTDASSYIFPTVDPIAEDDPSCLQDCSTCTIHYPPKWSIDEDDPLYGHINGWATHVLIATGKTDWVRDVADEKGSVMEAIGQNGTELQNGKCMVSACNMPIPDYSDEVEGGGREKGETEVLVLPKWEIVEDVKPSRVKDFMEGYVSRVASTMSPVGRSLAENESTTGKEDADNEGRNDQSSNGVAQTKVLASHQQTSPSPSPNPASSSLQLTSQIPTPISHPFPTRPCPHRALILLCSQKTRDARCGQSAPLLRREFERHLRPLGLYRDFQDERPGGVGIYFISHVGGHKYAANVMVYRRGGSEPETSGRGGGEGGSQEGGKGQKVWEEEREGQLTLVRSRSRSRSRSRGQTQTQTQTQNGTKNIEETSKGEAMQCIWLARVRPEDCEGIIKYTVLKGKVLKPDRQLRGGFDRGRGLTSW